VGKEPLQWRRRARWGWALLLLSGLLFLLAIWTPGDNSGRWAGTAALVLALAIAVLISALILYDDGD
jgi:peptidoglycan/LPS O-acetylase OafA/YrhL